MKLSDIMSAAGLSAYAEVSLLIFFAVFVAVFLRVSSKRYAPELERAASLPLDDGPTSPLSSPSEES